MKYYLENELFAEAGVEARPYRIWDWCINSGVNGLKTLDDDTVRLHLLRQEEGSISSDGIHFNGKIYLCDRFFKNGWGVLARDPRRKETMKVNVYYHSGLVDRVWILLPDKSFLPCDLHPKFARYRNKSFAECKLLDDIRNKKRNDSVDHDRFEDAKTRAFIKSTVSFALKAKELQLRGVSYSKNRLKSIAAINRKYERKAMQSEVVEKLPGKNTSQATVIQFPKSHDQDIDVISHFFSNNEERTDN